MSIKDILAYKGADVFSIRAGALVKAAAGEMRKHNVASLVVKQNDRIIGVLSEHDIVSAIARSGDSALSMPVEDVLSRILVTISPDDSIKHAMRLMTHHRVRHLLVLDAGHLVGIVSGGDVVKSRLEELELESNVLRDAYIAAH
jgi:CBS domain-containing protein